MSHYLACKTNNEFEDGAFPPDVRRIAEEMVRNFEKRLPADRRWSADKSAWDGRDNPGPKFIFPGWGGGGLKLDPGLKAPPSFLNV